MRNDQKYTLQCEGCPHVSTTVMRRGDHYNVTNDQKYTIQCEGRLNVSTTVNRNGDHYCVRNDQLTHYSVRGDHM